MATHHIGKGMPKPWITDPSLIMGTHVSSFVMVAPHGLEEFLDPQNENCAIRVIHGPKGSGKTSVVLAKRLLLQQHEEARKVLCIPQRKPYVFMSLSEGSKVQMNSWDVIGAYAKKDTWAALWKLIFGAYVLAALESDRRSSARFSIQDDDRRPSMRSKKGEELAHEGADTPLLPKELGALLLGDRYGPSSDLGTKPPDSEFLQIMRNLIQEKRATLATLREAYDQFIEPSLELLARSEQSKPIYVFVDGVDEVLQGYRNDPSLLMTAKGKGTQGVEDVTDVQRADAMAVWVYAQSSLFSASVDLHRVTSGAVRLIVSMRTEAWDHEPFIKGGAQLEGMVRKVRYTKAELDQIFRENIKVCDPAKLLASKGDEMTRFFGAAKCTHWKTNSEQEVFSEILRHTLEEPRDLMLMGSRLYDLSRESRKNPEEAAAVVNEATETILNDYLTYMGEAWNERIAEVTLPKIFSNVLTLQAVQAIADSVKAESNGIVEHPFCYLYSLGLIGIPKSIGGGKVIQEFLLPARFPSRSDRKQKLPRATHYFIHPVLAERVKAARSRAGEEPFVTNGQIVVGHELPFTLHLDQQRVVIGCQEYNGKVEPLLRIDGITLGFDENTDNAFSNFANLETAFLLATLLALARHATSGDICNAVTFGEIMKALDFFVRSKVVPAQIANKRTKPIIEHFEYVMSKYSEKNPKYPIFVERINQRILAGGARIRLGLENKGASFKVNGLMSSDIQVSGLFNWK